MTRYRTIRLRATVVAAVRDLTRRASKTTLFPRKPTHSDVVLRALRLLEPLVAAREPKTQHNDTIEIVKNAGEV